MKAVQFLVDDEGQGTAVLIDLKKNPELWDDFYDLAVARRRKGEPRESVSPVKKRLPKLGRSSASFAPDELVRGNVCPIRPQGTRALPTAATERRW
jgi:hypothetical protein